MSDEKKHDHDYDPEKIRGVIQDRLYCGPGPLGDAEPPENAEEIEDGVKVCELSASGLRRIFFCVMDSWFSFDVPADKIENDPTIAERFVSGEREKFTGEVEICPSTGGVIAYFEDGSRAIIHSSSWRVL